MSTQTLPEVVSDSLKASITPTLTQWIDAITDGTGTGDLIEYVLLLVDSIKDKKDFADDLAAFFGEEPAQKLTNDLFALIAQELVSSKSLPTVSIPSSIHDTIPPLESASPSLTSEPVTSSRSNVISPLQSTSVTSASPPHAIAGSRVVKLSSSASTPVKQVNLQSRDSQLSSRSGHRSRSPQIQSHPPPQNTAPASAKQISLKRTRDDDATEQSARKSITLKRGGSNDTLTKPRLNIRKRSHDDAGHVEEDHVPQKRQINLSHQSEPPALTVVKRAIASSYGDADMQDDSTGPDYVPILTDVNAPFQPQQPQSGNQSHAVKSNGRKHRLNVSNEQDPLDSSNEITAPATKTRCLFFPSCSKGDACPFFHPPPCAFFPKCRNGDKCPNYHPSCKFGAGCTNALCTYSHPANRAAPSASSVPAGAVPCRFGDQCTRTDCRYSHPRDKQSKGPRIGICAFDPNCNSIGCSLQHPQREAADRAWMAG